MDFSKIRFSSYIPSYDKYFNDYLQEPSITEFVSFSKWDSSLIFYENNFVGFYKTMIRDEDVNDHEIYIALIPEWRGKGIASYVVQTLTDNIFASDITCEFVHLSIDKRNADSIKMAISCGFFENVTLEQELRTDGDPYTLVFSMRNPFYNCTKEGQITR